jgi:cell division protein ZapA
MGDVTLTVAGRAYRLQCPEGDEAHIARLGAFVDAVAADARSLAGGSTEARQWLFTALLLADRLVEAEAAAVRAPADAGPRPEAIDTGASAEDALDRLAERAEALAERLEKLARDA